MRGDIMKNNIILILVVTVISIGIIIASILISAGGSGEEKEPVNPQPDYSEATPDSAAGTEESETRDPVPSSDFPHGWRDTSQPSAPTEDTPAPPQSEVAQGVIDTARSLIGIDFLDGGDSPSAGFDNSGFIYYVLRENGYITCPRGVSAQSEMGTAVGYDKLQPGDLALFYNDDMTAIGFGGIYCGEGKMIACLMPGTTVREIDINSEYYRGHFYRGVGLN